MKEEEKRSVDEKNLASFPFSSLQPRKIRSILVEYQDGEKTIRWTASASPPFFLPSPFGVDVYLALLSLTLSREKMSRTLTFSFYEIAQTLGLRPDGRLYRRIAEQLKRLAALSITAYSCFQTPDGTIEVIENIPLFSSLQLHSAGEKTNTITWGEIIWENIRRGYISPLNMDIYRLLPPGAKALMRFVCANLAPGEKKQFPISILTARLGMGESRREGKEAAKALRKAAQKLITVGVLKSCCVEKDTATLERSPENPFPPDVAEGLKKLGITAPQTVSRILSIWKEDPERVRSWLRYTLDNRQRLRNPAGFFLTSLQNPPPEKQQSPWEKLLKH